MDPAERRRAVVLVDGEHYPPVVRDALAGLRHAGIQPVLALYLGGTEKVARHGTGVDLGVDVAWVERAPDGGPAPEANRAAAALTEALAGTRADLVVDLSDEPVLDAHLRCRLASVALVAGVPYEGSDFAFRPPARERVATLPSIAVIGTGKRTGKTAVAGAVVRSLMDAGRTPVVVAMGRGGPPEPVVVEAGADLDPMALLAVADAGGHAASDFYEDAVTTGAATVGARRCGGGLAGAVAASNVAEAVRVAGGLGGDVLVIEGSGAAVPPVHADATVLVVPGDADPAQIDGYLGGYRVLLADLVVATMCESPRSSTSQVAAVTGAIRSISRRVPCIRTVFRPVPLATVSGASVLFATTAPAAVSRSLAESLERGYHCEVVGVSANLADRDALSADLQAARDFDVLLVELKAAAVDVAARFATQRGARVVFCDNRPVVVDGDLDRGPSPAQDSPAGSAPLGGAVQRLVALADERFAAS